MHNNAPGRDNTPQEVLLALDDRIHVEGAIHDDKRDKKQKLVDLKVSIGKEVLMVQNMNVVQELQLATQRLQDMVAHIDVAQPFTRALDAMPLATIRELADC